MATSLAGFWYCCRAVAVFVTGSLVDVSQVGASGARLIQLWHGTPLKKIGLDDRITSKPPRSLPYRVFAHIYKALFPFTGAACHAITSACPVASERLVSAFGVDQSIVKVTGYPRCDAILSSQPEPILAVDTLRGKWQARRVVSYIPTFRGTGNDGFDLLSGLDVQKLDDCLSRHQAVMFIKMHYYLRDCHPLLAGESGSSRVQLLSEDELADVSLLLPHTDVLLTDYSSVYFDYLLLDRPIIFTPFDKDYYMTRDRELYEDYDSATPGPKCMNWEETINELDRALGGADDYHEPRKRLQGKYNTFVDTDNSKRVVKLAKELVNGKSA